MKSIIFIIALSAYCNSELHLEYYSYIFWHRINSMVHFNFKFKHFCNTSTFHVLKKKNFYFWLEILVFFSSSYFIFWNWHFMKKRNKIWRAQQNMNLNTFSCYCKREKIWILNDMFSFHFVHSNLWKKTYERFKDDLSFECMSEINVIYTPFQT